MMNKPEQPHAPDIMRLIGDLAVAQHVATGHIDTFELKKSVLRRVWNIELRDDLALNMLPKKLNRALDAHREIAFQNALGQFSRRAPRKGIEAAAPAPFRAALVEVSFALQTAPDLIASTIQRRASGDFKEWQSLCRLATRNGWRDNSPRHAMASTAIDPRRQTDYTDFICL